MDDNHDLIETLLKGSTEADREHLLEVIRNAYVGELPESSPIDFRRPRSTPSKPSSRHRA